MRSSHSSFLFSSNGRAHARERGQTIRGSLSGPVSYGGGFGAEKKRRLSSHPRPPGRLWHPSARSLDAYAYDGRRLNARRMLATPASTHTYWLSFIAVHTSFARGPGAHLVSRSASSKVLSSVGPYADLLQTHGRAMTRTSLNAQLSSDSG